MPEYYREDWKSVIPWETTGLENWAMLFLSQRSPRLDGPCVNHIFQYPRLLDQGGENDFFQSLI